MKIGIASADYLHPRKAADGQERWGGAGWARIGQYIPHLREAGHEVTVGILWEYEHCMAVEDAHTGDMVVPDVVILQRLMHDNIDKTIRKGIDKGQIAINDLDDWYFGLDTRNEAWKASHPKFNETENTNFYAKNIGASSYVTVSTPFLAEKVRSKFGGTPVLLPNTVDVSRFTPVVQSDMPTYGWAGSTAHRSGDIETLRGLFERFVRDGSLKLHHSGDSVSAPSFASLLNVPPEWVTTVPMSTTDQYPSLLTMDVGLVPLTDKPFNHAKSDIKGLEYAASGIPFIASALPSYSSLMESWGTGFCVARRPKDWLKSISLLLDINMRMEYQAALLELVQQRDISVGASALIDFLEALQ